MQNTLTTNGLNTNLGSNFSGKFSEIKGIFSKFVKWLKVQMMINRTSRELSQLSDRQLSDIGISKTDIPSVVRGKHHRSNVIKYYL